jgi:two-component system, NtrC family, nitrogen regulation sensor histidine kinase GlnL
MDRLLTPHRLPQPCQVNIHEVLERVRSVLLAEFSGIAVRRDYDTSLPSLEGDREQLIQAVLNIARNAAQAIRANPPKDGKGEIRLQTRVARQVTLARKRYRNAIELQVIDNGPGIPADIHERVFYPLVSGREGGSGLGLTLAQNFVSQHHGTITFESAPGLTVFSILLPLQEQNGRAGRELRN